MPINAKAKGSRLERLCIKQLTAEGYECTKAGGSLGVWDIIAISKRDILLIQVKANRKPGKDERLRMQKFEAPSDIVRKELWIYKDGFPNDPIITKVDDAN